MRSLPIAAERTTLEIKTGTWRTRRPRYVESSSPCRVGCPAGEEIPRWMNLARQGDYLGAWRNLREENPFPAITGRVCPHPCESVCHRGSYDSPLAINAVERFLGDWGIQHGQPTKVSGRHDEWVAVVGGGPAGLSCAYHLSRFGYKVTIFESRRELGGLLRYGIPEYRLPRTVLKGELDLLLAQGIEVRLGVALGREMILEDLRDFSAVFLATGSQTPLRPNIPGAKSNEVRDGVGFLREVNDGGHPELGARVIVVGGGSSAMDVARAAKRLGAVAVSVLCLESREQMPAFPDEVAEALEEGIQLLNSVGVMEIQERGGRVAGVRAQSVHLEIPSPGVLNPIPIQGSEFEMGADTVLLAIGQSPDISILPAAMSETLLDRSGLVAVSGSGATSLPGLFAGGDITPTKRTVAHAIGSGKTAAIGIDRWLRGREVGDLPGHIQLGDSEGVSVRSYLNGRRSVKEDLRTVVPFPSINLDYFKPRERVDRTMLSPAVRGESFAEVMSGLDEGQALAEAARCFSCGVCVLCDNCLIFCPDMAIHRRDTDYEVLLDYCKGCGVCAFECPRGALVMVPE